MTTLITNSQFKQFDADGLPLAGGKIYTYIVGTTTNKVTYQDKDKVAAHENPIILDAWGEATIWIDGDTKFVVTDSDDVEIRTYPSFSDSGTSTEETPVIPSPEGAVLRSITTETGYVKIQLPMGEWPNTKMTFDVSIFEDNLRAVKLNLAGFANSNTEQWEDTTAITNGIIDYDIQFGNDGTYPCVYIGAVDSEWENAQIVVSNFFAGQFEYDYASFDNGWDIIVTTTLGTITGTPTLLKKYVLASDSEVQAGTETEKIVTPAGLNSRTGTEERTGLVELSTDSEAVALTDTDKVLTPANLGAVLDGMDIIEFGEAITLADYIEGTWVDNNSFAVPIYRGDTFIGAFFRIDVTAPTNTDTDIFILDVAPLNGLGSLVGRNTEYRKLQYASTVSISTIKFSSETPTKIRMDDRNNLYTYIVQGDFIILADGSIT